jgi:hypothetical protein
MKIFKNVATMFGNIVRGKTWGGWVAECLFHEQCTAANKD